MGEYIGKIYIDDSYFQQEVGEQSENLRKIEEIVSQYTEKEYNEQIAQEKNWAILFALSHLRGNIIQWLPIKKTDKVLEIGAGTGALTDILSSLSQEVTATETSIDKCRILGKRLSERENISVYAGRIQEVKEALTQKYDWIILVDSFQKAYRQADGERPHEALLDMVKDLLTEHGQIVLASANRLGLRYFAGEQEELGKGYFSGIQGYDDQEKKKTFSRPELIQMAESCGYAVNRCYYPYPDHKLPMTMYSDEYLPKVGELWDNQRNFEKERYVLFDETKAFDNIIKDGLFPVFSNAFLLFLSSEKEAEDKEKLLFTKYSNERGRSYAIRTDIIRKEKSVRIARKSACFPEGEAHVSSLLRWQKELGAVYQNSRITLNRCWKGEYGVEMEYLTGETLEEHLDRLSLEGKHDQALQEFLDYLKTVEEAGSQKTFVITPQFTEVFGERILPLQLLCSDVTDIDMVAGNAILDGDSYIHMDYEWTFDFPIPVRYVLYRIIQNYLYGNVQRTAMEREWLYKRIGLTDLEIDQYTKMEESFQEYIRQHTTPLRFLYEEMSPGSIRFSAEEERRREEAKRNAQNNTGIDIFIDSFEIAMTGIYVYGWAVSKAEKKVTFRLLDEAGGELEVLKTEYLYRKDVADQFKLSGKNSYAGFRLQCKLPGEETTHNKLFTLVASDGSTEVPFAIPVGKLRLKQSRIGKKLMELRGAKDVIQYIAPKDMGLITESDQYRVENQRFDTWRMAHRLSEKELERQRQMVFKVQPYYSVVILSENEGKEVRRSIESVRRQTYNNYEIINSTYDELCYCQFNGDYIFLMEPGDTMTANALYEYTAYINEHGKMDIIYSDSDQRDSKEKCYYDPQFKPDYATITLQSGNYIGNSVCFRKELFLEAGALDGEYERQAVYDLILRCIEKTDKVGHISNILYHSERPMKRDAQLRSELATEWELGRKALLAYYQRQGLEAEVCWAREPLRYTVKWPVSGNPKVSIIIPTQDHIDDLEKCLSSIFRKSTYENIEVLVVENNSRLSSTFSYYKKMEERYPKVRLLTWVREFNYSAINNFAAKQAEGDYYLFLNNDTEVLTCDWIEEMVSVCQQKNVGIVGSRLYYPDGTLQHAGVILGLGSIAGHLFVKEPGNISGYMGKVVLKQNLSAVTAACMMSTREAFEKIGGFDEKLKVALNDVDFCMRCQAEGYMVVYDPDVELYHYESKSRGLDTTPEKKARYDDEAALFTSRWNEVLKKGDPYYNVNLSRTTWNCTFRIPRD